MAHILLSETDEWQLVHDEQDLRGRDLLDPNGLRLGEVADMVINTHDSRVDEVILTDGTRYPAADLDIEDQAVYLRGASTAATRTPYAAEGVTRVETFDDDVDDIPTPIVDSVDESVYSSGSTISGTDAGALGAVGGTISGASSRDYVAHCATLPRDEHDTDFENHYRQTYQASGKDFDFYRPAYRFGHDLPDSQSFLGVGFSEAEPDVQSRFASSFPGLRYDTLADAIRFGFERRRG